MVWGDRLCLLSTRDAASSISPASSGVWVVMAVARWTWSSMLSAASVVVSGVGMSLLMGVVLEVRGVLELESSLPM